MPERLRLALQFSTQAVIAETLALCRVTVAIAAVLLYALCSANATPLFTDRYDNAIQDAVHKFWGDFPYWLAWKAQLAAESNFNPDAVSSVGAVGIAQFMPETWAEISREMGLIGISPRDAKYAIQAGAFYMAKLRTAWNADRSPPERHWWGVSSYNAGTRNVLSAQRRCHNALLWLDLAPCLPAETSSYVRRIWEYWQMMELEH